MPEQRGYAAGVNSSRVRLSRNGRRKMLMLELRKLEDADMRKRPAQRARRCAGYVNR